MTRFILFSFLLMGWVFYELSGGADFEPRRVASVDAPAPVRLVAGNDVIVPDPAKVAAIVETPVLTRVSQQSAPKPEPEIPAARASLTFNLSPSSIGGGDTDGGSLQLASLTTETGPVEIPIEGLGSAQRPASRAVAEPVVAPIADLRAVTGSRVNMRAGPGTNYEVVASLTRGEQVDVLNDPGTGWLELRPVGGGPSGWMASRLVSAPSQ